MRHCLSLLVCLVFLAGCQSNSTQPTPSCTYTLSPTAITVGTAGGTASVTVTTGAQCNWAARSESAWITTSTATSMTGSGTVSFAVAQSTNTTPRVGTLTVAGQVVSVSQEGVTCTYALAPPTRTVDAAGGTATFDVSVAALCAWTVGSTAPWLTIAAGGSGSGNGTVTYLVAANPDTSIRTANLTAASVAHAVTQTGRVACTIGLSKEHDSIPVAGGTGTFDVTSAAGCGWTATSQVNWIRVTDPPDGPATGNRTVTYVVDANAGAASRTGTITIADKAFTVVQPGTANCDFEVAPTDVRACMAEGFVRTVAVTTGPGCPWTASAGAAWLSIVSGSSGAGSGTISYTIGHNFDAARQDLIEVRWPTPTAGQNVRVAQAGCLYGVSRNSVDVPAAGGDFSFDVVSSSTDTSCGGPLQNGCQWSAVSSASWVTVLSWMPRWGDDRVSFRVATNGTGSPRSTTITVRDRTIVIRQAG